MDEARVKSLTGGDSVTCRFLFKELFTYTPEFKILCAGNHKPKIRGNDLGIWRRQILIPFEVTIPEEERDPKLQDKLIKELPGILAWAVQGCAGWQKTGLNPPQEVKTATDEYRKSEDVFAQWLDECCATGSHMITTAKDLLDSFIEFSKWRGTTATKMGLMLSDAGFTRDRSTGHSRWVGLGLTRTADNRHWQDKDDESDRPF
jgi:putative DNA primase/helicase